jgi:hypothetical protein
VLGGLLGASIAGGGGDQYAVGGAVVGGLALGGLGMIGGMFLGGLNETERWERVPLDR